MNVNGTTKKNQEFNLYSCYFKHIYIYIYIYIVVDRYIKVHAYTDTAVSRAGGGRK